MADITFHLQVTRPREARLALGQWLRLARQRMELTQPMLASKSGVPVTTLSRFEREGEGSVDSLMRLLQALGELDRFHADTQERLRQASIPRDLSELQKPSMARQRVRVRKPGQENP